MGAAIIAATIWSLATPAGSHTPLTAPLPTPTPADVLASGTVSAYPAPGASTVSPRTAITFRGNPAAHLDAITVVGSTTGPHVGTWVRHSDGQGATFSVADRPFAPGETVTVRTVLLVRGSNGGAFAFRIAQPAPLPVTTTSGSAQTPGNDTPRVHSFVSRADLRPAEVKVRTARHSAPGNIFVTPSSPAGQSGPLILDDQGEPVWFAPLDGKRAFDFRVQQYHGKPVLTWFEGTVSKGGYGQGEYVLADSSYHEIGRVGAGNGYSGDLHDFQLTPQGTGLLLAYSPVLTDAAGSRSKTSSVMDAVVQEIDIPTGSVLFEWHSLDAVKVDESYESPPDRPGQPYDYLHPNSVALDTDGNVLVSARHTSSVYKIDRTTGVLHWRLGGKKTNFVMGAGTTFAWQHDARAHPDGTITIFDNGARSGRKTHDVSRGLVLDVNEHTRKARLVRELKYRGRLAESQGNLQHLPNGGYLIGWGDQPEYSEFDRQGKVVYDAEFVAASKAKAPSSYRAYRFPWVGSPTEPPTATATRRTQNGITVSASWNGATQVTDWQVLAGPKPEQLAVMKTAPRQGFESTIDATTTEPIIAVRALDRSGNVLATSPAVPVAPASVRSR